MISISTMYTWVFYFFVYCIFGWLFESTVVSISKRRFVNRGFLKGPFLPLYGFGALSILLSTLPVRSSAPAVFLVGMLVATALEYVTGALMERLFKVRYWDYSRKRFQIKGRICLTSSLAWGALSLFVVFFVHAYMERLAAFLGGEIIRPLVLCMGVIFLYDFSTSFRSALDLRRLLEQNEALRRETEALRARLATLETHAVSVKESVSEHLEDMRTATGERLAAITERLAHLENIPDEIRAELLRRAQETGTALEEMRAHLRDGRDLSKLLRRNPGATSVSYAQALRETLEAYKNVDERAVEAQESAGNRFAQGLNFYKLFWIFLIGCVLGVVVETLFCLLTRGHYENRVGVIWGPLSPVYGIGCVALSLGLYFLRFHRDIHILFMGALVGSVVEYVCSWAQETFLGSTSWDYSHIPYNINGRICLLYAIFWGVLAVYWIKDLFPRINLWILRAIPNKIGKPLTWLLFVLVAFDIVMSLLAQRRWEARLYHKPPETVLDSFFDARFDNARMETIFPNMTFHLDEASDDPAPETIPYEEDMP